MKTAYYLTRFLYSSVRVSISILSPMLTKAGTGSSKPVASLAGFMTLPEVSPLTAGSVKRLHVMTLFGSSTEMALPLVENDFTSQSVFQILQCVDHVFGLDFVLVIVGVHEHVHWVGEVGVGHFLLVEDNLFELVVSL